MDENIFGTPSPDLLRGSPRNDIILGLGGVDTIFGNQGNDLLFGNQGNDLIYGGKGADSIWGGKGDDLLFGNLGDDFLNGNLGNDSIYGGQGNDIIHGGQGNDLLSGDLGNDVLYGDLGTDTLTGGPGQDKFVLAPTNGGSSFPNADLITDFTEGTDLIGLSGGLRFQDLNFIQVTNALDPTGTFVNSTAIQDKITGRFLAVLIGITPAQVKETDFTTDLNPISGTPTPTPLPDLTIAKTGSADPITVGDPITYTLTVGNSGNANASNVTVADILPAGFVPGATTVSNGFTASTNGQTVTFSGGSIAAGGSATLTIAAATGTATPGSATDNAAVDPQNTITESNENNNTAQATTQVNPPPLPDLTIAKTGSADPITVGDPITYTLTVGNSGNANASNVTVADILPAGFVPGATTVSNGFTASTNGQTVTFSGGSIAAGGSATLTIAAATGTATPGSATDNAAVDPQNTITESNENNNTAQATTQVNPPPLPDLTIAKTGSADPITVGDPITYTLTVGNSGNANASNVTVADILPAGFVPGATTVSNGFTASTNGQTVTFSGGSIAAGGSATLTIAAATGTATPGSATDNAAVDPQNTITESNENNNTAQATTQVNPPPLPDLTIAKTGSADPITVGDPITYTLTVGNSGNANASNVTVADILPAGFVPGATTVSNGFTASTNGQTVTFSGGSIAAGGSATLTIAAATGTATPGSATDNAAVDPQNTITESNENNNTAQATTQVNPPPLPDLTIAKTGSADPITVGDPITYTLTVGNSGNANASNVTVADILPAGFVPGATTVSNGFTASTNGQTVTFSGGSIAAGGSATLTIAAATGTATPGSATDNAAVDPQNTITESNENNNTAQATTQVNPPPLPDLTIAKTGSADPITVGDPITYTLTVGNSGNANASNVTVADILPAGFVPGATTVSNGFTASTNGQTVTFSGGSIAAGGSATLTIAAATGTATPGSATDNAAVDPQNTITESNENNNTAQATTQVNPPPLPDLTIAKTGSADPITVGDPITYTLTVGNSGNANASNVTVADILPAGFVPGATTVSNGFTASTNGQTVTFSGGSIAAGGSATLTIAAATGTATPGSATDNAAVDPQNTITESNENNNTATATTTVNALPAPVAANDGALNVIGNVGIDTTKGTTFSVLTNDTLNGGTISAFDATSANGGTVSLNTTNGEFTYIPAAGFRGTDTFTYTLMNGGGSSKGTVTLNVANEIWFVDGANGSDTNGNGTLAKPFKTLTPLNTGGSSDALDGPGDDIFLYSAPSSYNVNNAAGFVLENNQELIGQGATGTSLDNLLGITLPTFSNTLPSINGTRPIVTDTSGSVISLASGNTIRGLNVGDAGGANNFDITGGAVGNLTISDASINNTQGGGFNVGTSGALNVVLDSLSSTGGPNGVNLVGSTGTFTANSGTITNPTGADFNISGGSVNSTYSGNITQANNAATVSVSGGHTGTATFTGTISATNGTGLQFNNADGTYNFNGTTTLNGGDAGIDIVNGSGGTFTFGSGTSINNPSGIAYNEDTSTANVTYNSTIAKTNNANSAVRINAKTGGTTTFNGAISGTTTTANAINLTSNTGGTVNFTGSLTLNTTSGTGFNATGGGTVSATGARSAIASTTGTALNVANTTIGASNLNFQSINSIAASGNSGIVLNNTGSAGGLTVTGDGSTLASGGTISKNTNGISLTNTAKVNLSNMDVLDNTLNGILGTTIAGINLTRLRIRNNTNANNLSGLALNELSGTSLVSNTEVSGSTENNVTVTNSTAAGGTITFDNDTIANNSTTSGNDGIRIATTGTGTLTANVTNSNFSGNRTIALQSDAADNSNLTVNFNNNTIVAGTGGNNQGNQGIEVDSSANATVNFQVNGNKVGTNGATNAPLLNTGINIFAGSAGTATMTGTVKNNTVFNAGAGVSGFGIRVFNSNNASIFANVSGNTVNNVGNDFGILAESSGATSAPASGRGVLTVGVTGNTSNVLSGALDSIRVQARNFNTVNARINGNTTNSGGSGFFGLFVRQANSAVFNLEGLTTGPQNTTTTQTYLTGQNPSASTVGAGLTGATFTGVASVSGIPA